MKLIFLSGNPICGVWARDYPYYLWPQSVYNHLPEDLSSSGEKEHNILDKTMQHKFMQLRSYMY